MQRSVKALSESDIQVLWQTGKSFVPETGGLKHIKASTFIQDMCTAYAAADYVVSRAGAISVSELCLLKKPSILIPSPNVAEDHQTKNALALSAKNAAILVRDNEAEEKLLSEILSLSKDKVLQQRLSDNISEFAKPDALAHIVDELESLKL
jgi:UDP-N-acetylglucosamine--N-acetylmuramyl-(pentapeptide) pyrophosphoryl-undecaprenol N-acetylglucosamine transferase